LRTEDHVRSLFDPILLAVVVLLLVLPPFVRSLFPFLSLRPSGEAKAWRSDLLMKKKKKRKMKMKMKMKMMKKEEDRRWNQSWAEGRRKIEP